MSAFLMPSLGADMEAGTLVEKSIAAGDPVRRGDIIGAVETQKGVIEMEVFDEGILENWLVDIGARVPVGTPLAVIRDPNAAEPEVPEIPEPTPPQPTPPEEPAPSEPIPEAPPLEDEPPADPGPAGPTPELPDAPPMPEITPSPPETGRLRATPAARRLAVQRGIDLATVPMGADGTITYADVETMKGADAPSGVSDMRAAIAAAMSRAKREIPHYYLSHQVDLNAADSFLRQTNADRTPEDRLVIGVLAAKAIAKALKKYPEFNGHFTDGSFAASDAVHLGMAINIRGGGLVAPGLFDAEAKPLDLLMSDLHDLVARVRSGRFRARELSEPTITLTSLGERGVDRLYGVIYPPQVAIIGFGTPRLQPMVHEGAVVPRLASNLTLAADHRVSDGHRGALFLKTISKHLQRPEDL